LLKKEKNFNSGDYVKWEIPMTKLHDLDKTELIKNKLLAFDLMFPKETAHVEELKETFAFYEAKSFEELKRSFESSNKSFAKNFTMFTKMQAENLTSGHIHFADCMSHFAESGGIKKMKHSGSILGRESVMRDSKEEVIHVDDHNDEIEG